MNEERPPEPEPHAPEPRRRGRRKPRDEVEPPEVEARPLEAADAGAPTIDAPPPPASPPPPPEAPECDEPAGREPSDEPPPIPPAPIPRGRRLRHAWAAICHLLLFAVIPTVFLGAVLTFFLWQIAGRRDDLVEDQGREALNFQINVAVLTALLGITCLGAPLVPIVWLVALIFCVIAALRAAEGRHYRYPWVLRVVTH